MNIEMGKEYKCPKAGKVRILCIDAWGKFPVMFRLDNGHIEECTLNGMRNLMGENHPNLIEVKPRIKAEQWFNIYRAFDGAINAGNGHDVKELAEQTTGSSEKIACIKVEIDCEEGEGL